jgi:hypothetical protein
MAGALWWAVKGALTKRHFDRAYRLSQQLLEMPEPLNLLHSFLASFDVSPALLDLLTQSSPAVRYRVLLHSLASAGKAVESARPAALSAGPAGARRVWTSARKGGRRGRTFYVTADALAEWNVVPAPVTRLQGEPTLVAEDTAANYWTTVWSTGGGRVEEGRLVFNTDQELESFYEKHFPDDIPDEWPSEERIKSHGQARHDAPKNVWRSAFLLCFASS